jgi:hypothetical protein
MYAWQRDYHHLEMAHVLFIDIVGYSKLLVANLPKPRTGG